MKMQKQISMPNGSDGSSIEADLVGLQVMRIPVGSFAGTIERLFLTKNCDFQGFDTGNQGGGQN
jgi:hypothetical protein